jgi:poly(3-hydroxybutyrate) depolymerase
MDAHYYLETIATVFQEFKLVNGTWDVRNPDGKTERVRPQDIKRTALLTIEGELDDISGSGQTAAAHGLCTGIAASQQKHMEVKGAGHYGIFSGRRWREMVYPVVKGFVLSHQTSPTQRLAAAPAALKPKAAAARKTPARAAPAPAPRARRSAAK